MSETQVVSFDEMQTRDVDEVTYDTVEAHGRTFEIGSVSAEDYIEWTEGNEDPAKKREAGLRLLVKSLVQNVGTKEKPDYIRVPKERFDAMLDAFRKKSAKGNGKIINAALKLNGIVVKQGDGAKNVSGEAATDASPTASPSPQAV